MAGEEPDTPFDENPILHVSEPALLTTTHLVTLGKRTATGALAAGLIASTLPVANGRPDT